MSYGSLSKNAVLALNTGAKLGGFAHNTGEGGLSPVSPRARRRPDLADRHRLLRLPHAGRATSTRASSPKRATLPNVKMIEIKLSQGAKPGHGGILPAAKLTPEIVAIRGVRAGQGRASRRRRTRPSPRPPSCCSSCSGCARRQRRQARRLQAVRRQAARVPRHREGDARDRHHARLHHASTAARAAPARRRSSSPIPSARRSTKGCRFVHNALVGAGAARPHPPHRLGQGEHRLPDGDQGRARRRHVQRGARDDVRARLHPGAALQQQPLPRGRGHAGSGPS